MELFTFQKHTILFFLLAMSSANNSFGKWGRRRSLNPRGYKIYPPFEEVDETVSIPESFDAREKWPQCKSIGKITDQGECGSCWAVATAAVLTDRWCITYGEHNQFEFSAEDLFTCCRVCTKFVNVTSMCDQGGRVPEAVKYWAQHGIVSGGDYLSDEGCKPYSNETFYGDPLPCQRTCTNVNYKIPYEKDKRFGKTVRIWLSPQQIKQAQNELMTNGPLVAILLTGENMTAGTDVYQWHGNVPEDFDWHTIKVIGWGVEKKIKYWLIANSYGTDWGEMQGFFKILRGENHLSIENYFAAPSANSSTPSFFARLICYCLLLKMILCFKI